MTYFESQRCVTLYVKVYKLPDDILQLLHIQHCGIAWTSWYAFETFTLTHLFCRWSSKPVRVKGLDRMMYLTLLRGKGTLYLDRVWNFAGRRGEGRNNELAFRFVYRGLPLVWRYNTERRSYEWPHVTCHGVFDLTFYSGHDEMQSGSPRHWPHAFS